VANPPGFFWSDWPEEKIRKWFGDADPMSYMAEMQRQGNNLECTDQERLRFVARLVAETEQPAEADPLRSLAPTGAG
jgi:hypothetical protein